MISKQFFLIHTKIQQIILTNEKQNKQIEHTKKFEQKQFFSLSRLSISYIYIYIRYIHKHGQFLSLAHSVSYYNYSDIFRLRLVFVTVYISLLDVFIIYLFSSSFLFLFFSLFCSTMTKSKKKNLNSNRNNFCFIIISLRYFHCGFFSLSFLSFYLSSVSTCFNERANNINVGMYVGIEARALLKDAVVTG